MVDLDQGVESLSQNVKKILMEMDIELYEASAAKFELETEREAQLAAAATEMPKAANWETVEQLAMSVRLPCAYPADPFFAAG